MKAIINTITGVIDTIKQFISSKVVSVKVIVKKVVITNNTNPTSINVCFILKSAIDICADSTSAQVLFFVLS